MPCPFALSLSKPVLSLTKGVSRTGSPASSFPRKRESRGEAVRSRPLLSLRRQVEARLPYSRSSLYMTSCGNISSHGCFRSVSPCASEKDCAMSKALALAAMP